MAEDTRKQLLEGALKGIFGPRRTLDARCEERYALSPSTMPGRCSCTAPGLSCSASTPTRHCQSHCSVVRGLATQSTVVAQKRPHPLGGCKLDANPQTPRQPC